MRRYLFTLVAVTLIAALMLVSAGCGKTNTISMFDQPGIHSNPGLQGEKGDKGDKGDTGLQGPVGPQGPKGEKGDKGDTVTSGGGGGGYAIPVQGSQGDKGDPGEQGIQGIQGEQGIPGTFPYTIQMGTCSVLFSGGYGDEVTQLVSFSPGFAGVPVVFVNVTGSAKPASNFNAVATGITAGGFTAKIRYFGASALSCTVTFCWLAVSP